MLLRQPLSLEPELWRLVLRVLPDELELDFYRGQEPDPEPQLRCGGAGRRLGALSIVIIFLVLIPMAWN